jgi:hypothetical protein
MTVALATLIRHPGYLPIKHNQFYQFQFKGKKVAIGLLNNTKGVKIVDNNNHIKNGDKCVELDKKLDKFTKGYVMKVSTVSNEKDIFNTLQFSYEIDNDREIFIYESYYTDFFILLEIEDFKIQVYEDDKKRERYNVKVFDAFNYFIRNYNKASKGGNISHIDLQSNKVDSTYLKQAYFKIDDKNSFESCLEKKESFSMEGTSISMGGIGDTGIIGQTIEEIQKVTHTLQSLLLMPETPENEFLSYALEQLQLRKNYKYAFLEAFLAIEFSIEAFLNAKKIKANISKQQIDDFKREVGIGYKMNIELPLALGTIDNEFKALLSDINKIRKLRNEIVHSGKDVSDGQARGAINSIYSFVDYLKKKM